MMQLAPGDYVNIGALVLGAAASLAATLKYLVRSELRSQLEGFHKALHGEFVSKDVGESLREDIKELKSDHRKTQTDVIEVKGKVHSLNNLFVAMSRERGGGYDPR